LGIKWATRVDRPAVNPRLGADFFVLIFFGGQN